MKYRFKMNIPDDYKGKLFTKGKIKAIYCLDPNDYPIWFEPVPDRITLTVLANIMDSNYIKTSNFLIESSIPVTKKMIDVMEKAANWEHPFVSESFTREDMETFGHRIYNTKDNNISLELQKYIASKT